MGKPVTVPDNIIKLAAEAGAKAALEAFAQEKKRAQKFQRDRRLHNTKLLLRNYRMFQQHIDQAVYEESQLYENVIASALGILYGFEEKDDDQLYVESIKRSQARTQIIMQHIDHMLDLYKTFCGQSKNKEDLRRYNVIAAMYISEPAKSVEEIATQEHINTRTVYKDVDAACITLSALIFGIDGLKMS